MSIVLHPLDGLNTQKIEAIFEDLGGGGGQCQMLNFFEICAIFRLVAEFPTVSSSIGEDSNAISLIILYSNPSMQPKEFIRCGCILVGATCVGGGYLVSQIPESAFDHFNAFMDAFGNLNPVVQISLAGGATLGFAYLSSILFPDKKRPHWRASPGKTADNLNLFEDLHGFEDPVKSRPDHPGPQRETSPQPSPTPQLGSGIRTVGPTIREILDDTFNVVDAEWRELGPDE